MPSKKSQKSQEATPKINGAIAAQACIYHWQRLRYHEAAGRTDVAKQHAEAYQTMLKSLNGARRRVVDLATPVIQPYQGPEVTTFVDFVIPERRHRPGDRPGAEGEARGQGCPGGPVPAGADPRGPGEAGRLSLAT